MLRLIDSHAHVQFPAYDADREAIIFRALEASIGMVNVGTQYTTSADAIRLAERHANGVWATVGFHPGHVAGDTHHDSWELAEQRQEVFDAEKFRALAAHPRVVAVGECGLDYAHFARKQSERLQNGASAEAFGGGGLPQEEIDRRKKRQQEVFVRHIELAHALRKPLVVHCRRAFADLIDILNSKFQILNSPAGAVHFFSGSREEARKLLDLGFFLGFGGVITFARDYDEVVKNVPLDRLLVETDAPYVSPAPYRGRRNEPAYITETVKKIAELRGISYDEVAAATTANARQLFSL